MTVIRYSERAVVPWKNGAGVRRDLFAGEYPGDRNRANSGTTWLIGIADLNEDAPFSSYPGVSRWFMPISAGRLTLMFRAGNIDHPVELNGASPAHHFSGSDEVHLMLHEGPMKALNLMTTGSVQQVTMDRLRLPTNSCLHWLPNRPGTVSLLLLVNGQCRVIGEGLSVILHRFDACSGDDMGETGVELHADRECDLVRVLVRLW